MDETKGVVRLNDIRRKTGIIVANGNEFLVGVSIFNRLRWSLSPWDAWRTRSVEDARRVADKVGGKLMLFNPVAGQLRGLNDGN